MAMASNSFYSIRYDDLSAMWAVVSHRARDVPLAYHARRRGQACAPSAPRAGAD